MQDANKAIPHFCSCCRIALTIMVSVFLACSLCAQDPRWQRECETLFSTAVRAEQQNDPIEAEFRYEECRELAQKYRLPRMEASALHRLAVIRARNKKFTESATLFRRAIDLDPRNALVLRDYAQLHADRKDFDEAEKLLKKAFDLDPNNPQVLFTLGSLIASQKVSREAEGLRYLKLAVGEREAYLELARIYRSKGDISRAEFAEQKAQLAGNSPVPTGNNAVAGRPPYTPPEVVQRVRQENFLAEAREMIADQQRIAAPPVGQPPFIPAPTNPGRPNATPSTIAAIPAAPPIDPFDAALRPMNPPANQPDPAVRRLGPPTESTVTQAAVRMIPNNARPLPVIQPTEQQNKRDPFSPILIIENDSVSDAPEQQLIKVISPTRTEPKTSSPPSPMSENLERYNTPPIRVVPNGAKPVSRSTATNPLRQIPPGGLNLLDSIAGVPLIAALPSYSVAEARKMPRIDEIVPVEESPKDMAARPKEIIALETVPSAEKTEIARSPRQLPVRDVDVLQSPSAVMARRESPGIRTISSVPNVEENVYSIASIRTEQTRPAMSPPESIKIIQSDRSRFISANAPEVAAFGKNPPPAEMPIEVVPMDPLEHYTPARSLVKLPQVPGEESDYPKMLVNIVTPAPAVADSFPVIDPFPVMDELPIYAEIKREEQPIAITEPDSPVVAMMPSNPLSTAGEMPKFSEVRNIQPLTPIAVPPSPVEVAAIPNNPLSTAGEMPKFSEVRNIQPLTPIAVPPSPMEVAATQRNPLPMVDDGVKFNEVKAIEPRTPVASPNPSVVAVPPDPFSVKGGEQPKFADVKPMPSRFPLPMAEQPKVAARTPESLPMAEQPKVMAQTQEPLPKVSPLPMAEQPKVVAQTQEPLPKVSSLPMAEQPKVMTQTQEPLPKVSPLPVAEQPKVVAQTQEPLPKVSPLPMAEQPKVMAQTQEPSPRVSPLPVEAPKVADARPVPNRSVLVRELPKPSPVAAEAAGFASSRRYAPSRVATSDDTPAGFARSRK